MRVLRAPAALSLACVLALAQNSTTTFRENVRLVHVLATVKDEGGAPVGSLEKGDFEVRDNGVPQEIAVFERQTEQPLSIAILVDDSASTAIDLKYETDSVTRFVKALVRSGNPDDAASLYTFNWEIVQQTAFTRNAAAIDKRLRQVRGDGGTAMYDAILLASRDIEDRQGRKVLVIVTDGGDTVSRATFGRAAEAAQLADAVIFPVLVVPISNNAGRNIGGENALTTLAERTGGRVFQPTIGKEMDAAFDGILRDLRTQYLLGFYPKNVPLTRERFHTLTVTGMGHANAAWTISARSGYYGEALPAANASANSSGDVNLSAPDETVRAPKPAAKSTQRGASTTTGRGTR
ncbi:MAG TPA: VWA domain-containing protein [Bryobacteraceae bacterium]|nr:VWA domain-containing protein [Bryobacteraceae bacterium]